MLFIIINNRGMKNPVHEASLEDVQWGNKKQDLTPKGPGPQSGERREALARKPCHEIRPAVGRVQCVLSVDQE